MSEKKEEAAAPAHRVWTVIGLVLCALLVPVLVINITLIVKSYAHQDEVPMIGGVCPLIVLTPSMEPEIAAGDLIVVRQIAAEDVKEKDVIAFFDPDSRQNSVLTHRVVHIDKEGGELSFTTKGDANPVNDPHPVKGSKLVGIYQFRIPGAGHAAMFMQSTTGLIVCVVVPLVLLIGWDVLRRRRSERKNKEDTEALLSELAQLKAQKAQREAEDAPPEDPKP